MATARLKARITAIDTAGNVRGSCTVTFYEPGTATASGGTTSGTPYAGNLYAAASGGSPISTTQTTDSNGELTVFTTSRQRFDVGFEYSSGARVTTYESMEFDPADVVTLDDTQTLTAKTLTAPVTTGQMTVATGTAGAPSIAKTGDTDTGFNVLATANVAQVVSGGIAAIAANIDSATAMVRIDRDWAGGAGLLSLQASNGASGVSNDNLGTLGVTRYSSDGGTAVKINNNAVDGSTGAIYGIDVETAAGGTWTSSNPLVIGTLSKAYAYTAGMKCYGANIFAQAIGASATGTTVVGIEVDPGGRVGSTVAARYGVMAVSNDESVVQASGEDVAFRVAAKSLGAKWKTAFLVDSGGGAWCMDPAGVILDARTGGGAAKGVDFSTVTFTSSAFLSPGFMVNPIGRVGIRVAGVDGAAPLRMNCDGDSKWMVLDSSTGIVQTTVGATVAVGVSALPATPEGYVILTIAGIDAVIPYYRKS